MIKDAVLQIRYRQPRVGGRKLYEHLHQGGISVGRDRLFDLLREWRLLVRPHRSYRKTTCSRHRLKVYKNLLKNQPARRPNEAWVCDITYVQTRERFGYLFLVTDQFSRKIVGYDFSISLSIEGALAALQIALKQSPDGRSLIHHSDRGIQYCSHDYVRLLERHGARISMTEDNHVYENALAERINGILKTELLGDTHNIPFEDVKHLIQEAISIYNNERLHMNLNYKTPDFVHNNN